MEGPDQAFLTQIKDRTLVPHFQATSATGSLFGTLLSFWPFLLFVGYFV